MMTDTPQVGQIQTPLAAPAYTAALPYTSLHAMIKAKHEEVEQASNEVDALLALRRSRKDMPPPAASTPDTEIAQPIALEPELRKAWERNMEMACVSARLSEEVAHNAKNLDLLAHEAEALREQLRVLGSQVAHMASHL